MPLRFLGVVLAVFLTATPAYASMFAGVGNVFKELARSAVDEMGMPLTLVSVVWGLLAMALRLGGMAWAVGGLLTGVALMNSEALVEAMWAAAH